MSEKQENLQENIERLKDDLMKSNEKYSEQEKEMKQLQQVYRSDLLSIQYFWHIWVTKSSAFNLLPRN